MTEPIVLRTYTTAEVARHLKVSPRTVANWAARGLMDGTKTPRGWRFAPADVETIITTPTQPHMHLESRVADVARARDLPTVRALARAAGLHRSTVSTWWGRLPRTLVAPTLCRLCKALDAQPGDLLELVSTPSE